MSYSFLPTEGTSAPFFVFNQFFSEYDKQDKKGASYVSSLIFASFCHQFLAFSVTARTYQTPAIHYFSNIYFLITYKPLLFHYYSPIYFWDKKEQVVFLKVQFSRFFLTQIFICDALHISALESQGDKGFLTLDSIDKISLLW